MIYICIIYIELKTGARGARVACGSNVKCGDRGPPIQQPSCDVASPAGQGTGAQPRALCHSAAATSVTCPERPPPYLHRAAPSVLRRPAQRHAALPEPRLHHRQPREHGTYWHDAARHQHPYGHTHSQPPTTRSRERADS